MTKGKKLKIASTDIVYNPPPPLTPTQHLQTGAKKTPSAIFLVITTVVSYSYEQTHVIFPKAT